MASRDFTGAMLWVCFGAVHTKATPSKLLDFVLDEMASCQRDLDKTGDSDSADYYEGMIDAFEMVALWIAPLKQNKEPQFNELLSKTGTRFPLEDVA